MDRLAHRLLPLPPHLPPSNAVSPRLSTISSRITMKGLRAGPTSCSSGVGPPSGVEGPGLPPGGTGTMVIGGIGGGNGLSFGGHSPN